MLINSSILRGAGTGQKTERQRVFFFPWNLVVSSRLFGGTYLSIHEVDNVYFFTIIAHKLLGNEVRFVGMMQLTDLRVDKTLAELNLGNGVRLGDCCQAQEECNEEDPHLTGHSANLLDKSLINLLLDQISWTTLSGLFAALAVS